MNKLLIKELHDDTLNEINTQYEKEKSESLDVFRLAKEIKNLRKRLVLELLMQKIILKISRI